MAKQIALRGFIATRLQASHEAHSGALAAVKETLERAQVRVRIIPASEFQSTDLSTDCPLVISAGGDGTFLQAASHVQKPIPVLGLNTDPTRSEGQLCSASVDASDGRFQLILDQLLRKFGFVLVF